MLHVRVTHKVFENELLGVLIKILIHHYKFLMPCRYEMSLVSFYL